MTTNCTTCKSFKACTMDKRFIQVSEKNRKLKPDKDTRYLIWNLPIRITCPYATELCKKSCYAKKAETFYPDAYPSRYRHLELSKQADFTKRMIFTIQSHLNRPAFKKAKKVVIRIHESGDFYNQEYANKWIAIAENFIDDPKVVFMAYTKSIEFFRNGYPENLVIRFSIWDDTKPEQIQLARDMNLPTYSAVKRFTNEPDRNRCYCTSCSECHKCWNKACESIVCEIH